MIIATISYDRHYVNATIQLWDTESKTNTETFNVPADVVARTLTEISDRLEVYSLSEHGFHKF